MKTISLLTTALAFTLATASFAADETAAKEGCKMMKKEAAPEPACCCCEKMMAKAATPAKGPDLESLIDKMKTAKGDQVLEAFAAVLNQILVERKAAQDKAPDAPAAPPAHQH